MNSSNKHSDIGFYGSITIIPQLIPPKFQFIALIWHDVFTFRTFLNSNRPQILTPSKTLCLKTPCQILADPTFRLKDTFNIVKLDSWKFHAKNPNFAYHIIYLSYLGS